MAYSSFVTDLNVETTIAYRIPIKPNRLFPIYGEKLDYERYAIPHMTGAARNIMHRQVLEEYRRGVIEQYLSQLFIFTVGTKEWPATPAKVRKIRGLVDQAGKNRQGALVVDHAVTAEVLAPKPLDAIIGNAAYGELTQMIMRDLGFSVFLISGEIPGEKGRGGGAQTDIDVQLSLERWEHRRTRFIKWATNLSYRFAKAQGDAALLKNLPTFVPTEIGIKQTQMIKDKIQPLFMMGLLSDTTALKAAGGSYDQELRLKKMEEPNKELFLPQPTFNQTATGIGGKETTSSGTPQAGGRPTGGAKAPSMKGSIDFMGQQDWRPLISEQFEKVLDNNMTAQDFGTWLRSQLTTRMTEAFQDGFIQYGGLDEPNYDDFTNATQGLNFHIDHAHKFVSDLQAGADPLRLRLRALMYAGAVHTAYVLGTQQAMKSHGAKAWQRELHPELSVSGPCADCTADANITHSIDEGFFEFHPGGVCAARSVVFHFGEDGNHRTRNVPVPEWENPHGPFQRPSAESL